MSLHLGVSLEPELFRSGGFLSDDDQSVLHGHGQRKQQDVLFRGFDETDRESRDEGGQDH